VAVSIRLRSRGQEANGHYVADGLVVSIYKVTLVVNGQVKAVILDAKTQLNKATQLNFGLTGKTASAKETHAHGLDYS